MRGRRPADSWVCVGGRGRQECVDCLQPVEHHQTGRRRRRWRAGCAVCDPRSRIDGTAAAVERIRASSVDAAAGAEQRSRVHAGRRRRPHVLRARRARQLATGAVQSHTTRCRGRQHLPQHRLRLRLRPREHRVWHGLATVHGVTRWSRAGVPRLA